MKTRVTALLAAGLLLAGCSGQAAGDRADRSRDTPAAGATGAAAADGAAGGAGAANEKPTAYNSDAYPDLAGQIRVAGSDTLHTTILLLADSFHGMHRDAAVAVEAKGSDFGFTALLQGEADIAAMSRELSAAEQTRLTEAFGEPARELPIARDAIAILVHRDNLVADLSIAQLDAIFSADPRRSGNPVRVWRDAGVRGAVAQREVAAYGRRPGSGTFAVFSQEVLRGAEFHPERVQQLGGSSAIVRRVSDDRAGIGYSGIGYATSGVRIVPVRRADGEVVYPDAASVASGDYPLARSLQLILPPRSQTSRELQAFIEFVLSPAGQGIVARDGFFPLRSGEG